MWARVPLSRSPLKSPSYSCSHLQCDQGKMSEATASTCIMLDTITGAVYVTWPDLQLWPAQAAAHTVLPEGKSREHGIFRVIGLECRVAFSAFQCQATWQGQPMFRRWTKRLQSHSTKEHVHMVPLSACFGSLPIWLSWECQMIYYQVWCLLDISNGYS